MQVNSWFLVLSCVEPVVPVWSQPTERVRVGPARSWAACSSVEGDPLEQPEDERERWPGVTATAGDGERTQ